MLKDREMNFSPQADSHTGQLQKSGTFRAELSTSRQQAGPVGREGMERRSASSAQGLYEVDPEETQKIIPVDPEETQKIIPVDPEETMIIIPLSLALLEGHRKQVDESQMGPKGE